nr:MAG TPA: hypothetical protein [Caudoviricetes sp.]
MPCFPIHSLFKPLCFSHIKWYCYTYILRYFRNKINILRNFYNCLSLVYGHYG